MSPVRGDLHAGFCESRGVRFPPATLQALFFLHAGHELRSKKGTANLLTRNQGRPSGTPPSGTDGALTWAFCMADQKDRSSAIMMIGLQLNIGPVPADAIALHRSPASIIIPAWNAWSTTAACLHSLRPTLGVHDQVIVVDNGSSDETPRRLKGFPWVEVETSPTNIGFGAGCNLGASRARHPYIVFLNNDTILHGRWLDPLVVAMDEDMTIAATGPRSNFVSGCQLVDNAHYTSASERRLFIRQWVTEHKGSKRDTDRLVGFCLVVRRSVFCHLGGFDERYGTGGYEDDDLCRRIRRRGHRLVVCDESFVHHEGHVTFAANNLDGFTTQEANRERFLLGEHDAHGSPGPRTGTDPIRRSLPINPADRRCVGVQVIPHPRERDYLADMHPAWPLSARISSASRRVGEADAACHRRWPRRLKPKSLKADTVGVRCAIENMG